MILITTLAELVAIDSIITELLIIITHEEAV